MFNHVVKFRSFRGVEFWSSIRGQPPKKNVSPGGLAVAVQEWCGAALDNDEVGVARGDA